MLPWTASVPPLYGFSSLGDSHTVEWGWPMGVKGKRGNFPGEHLEPRRGRGSHLRLFLPVSALEWVGGGLWEGGE